MTVTNIDNQSVIAEKKSDKLAKILEECGSICPVKDVMAKLGDRWAILSMLTLGDNGRMRFNAIKASIPDISQRMLTVTLRGLEQNGLVTRTIYPEIPPRVEYELTPLGKELLVKIMDLSAWAKSRLDDILVARKKYAEDYGGK